ncbi:hypothetical protein BLA60_17095 [Actinophytocola xinjiangensis]|uniref:CHAT domain-containing protein n=1 Tax=Actinophytocola xinjiangensis TaxID=485602 RepID=A0A7Z1AY66_9PSEU|nr:CHAT domain-containing protein [Actinophytocola xinjiangensis]OLF10162.1 hypothetical protein BLA60_17095 [Actinophytocola xinjiangensis]
MGHNLMAMVGGLTVVTFYAGHGRILFLTRYRQFGFGLGFLCYAVANFLGTMEGWGFDVAHVSFVIAGGAGLRRTMLFERQRRADAAFAPDQAALWHAEGQHGLRVFLATGDGDALDRAVDRFRDAVTATNGHTSQLTHRAALLTALQARYERRRHLDDLDEAIGHGRTVDDYRGGVRCGLVLSLLSTALRLRHDHVGGAGDLRDARTACHAATRLVPFRSRHFPRCSSEFAALYRAEYDRTEQPEFLDLAIERVRRGVRSARLTGAPRPVDLMTLCDLLAERGRHGANAADLTEAVDVGRSALRGLLPGDRLFQQGQNTLAHALRTRFGLLRRVDDLDEAIRLAHRASGQVSVTDPQWADHRLNLALALHDRHRFGRAHAQRDRNLGWALDAARDAATHDLADVPTRIRAGLVRGDIAASTGGYAEAVTAFAGVIGLLPLVASRELRREDQEDRLGRWSGIAANAAACALATGDQRRALVLLEQGRGVLLSRAMDTRADLTALHASHPALAAEFEELREALDPSPDLGDVLDSPPDAPTEDQARRTRRARTERWDDLLARIRAEDGLAGFAATPDPDRVLAQGAAGPVVYLTVSEYRADAIVVRPDGPRTVPLTITPAQVGERTDTLHHALRAVTDLDRQRAVHDVLAWLWDEVVEPVLDTAGITGAGPPPRVWWIPTGPLALLPIHAAGHHRDGISLLDRAISSYAPTVRALAAARDRPAARSAPRPLVVAMSHTPGAAPLPGAEREAALVRELFPGGVSLRDGEATRQRVLDELPGHTWAHFACHGMIDRDIPSRGRLLLHDHQDRPLTTADISRLVLPEPALAYLSSCETARTGPRHTDEAIHLASAFQLAGFPDVIATLWAIPDRAARDFTRDTYTELHRLIRSGAAPDAAGAVHAATRTARDKFPNLPGLWAGYVHLGR